MILMSLLAFSLRVFGGKNEETRRMVTEIPSAPVSLGDSFSVTVKAEKLPFIKASPHTRKRLFVCLVNTDSGAMQVQEVKNSD